MLHFAIYIDGYVQHTPGVGGYACLIQGDNDTSDTARQIQEGLKKTTSNRAKMLGLLSALETFESPTLLDIYCDSEYVCNAIMKNWLRGWESNNWVNRENSPVKNRDLWEKILFYLKKHTITCHLLKANSDKLAYVRKLAKEAANADTLSIDPAYGDQKAQVQKKITQAQSEHSYTIYTDGSCLGNPGPGGWAALIYSDTKDPHEMSGGFALTTNNRMEILSVVEALSSLEQPSAVELYSDSQYVCNAIEKGWIASWVKKNWVNSSKKPVKNKDLWMRLIPQLERHSVTFHWLRGHAGNPENERCDELARSFAARPNLPEDKNFVQDS